MKYLKMVILVQSSSMTGLNYPRPLGHRPDCLSHRVVGESMNRRIPNGSWCLFKLAPGGTRQGKVVLVQHRDIDDIDTGGHYTIKVYESEKVSR